MKSGIHPKYYDVTVTCACGETFKTRSTNPEIRLEICSKCHPYFTGRQKLIDSAGRVERFEKRYKATPPAAETAAPKDAPVSRSARRVGATKPQGKKAAKAPKNAGSTGV